MTVFLSIEADTADEARLEIANFLISRAQEMIQKGRDQKRSIKENPGDSRLGWISQAEALERNGLFLEKYGLLLRDNTNVIGK